MHHWKKKNLQRVERCIWGLCTQLLGNHTIWKFPITCPSWV